MSSLWDTCGLSELGKPNRDPDVARYLAGIPTRETWISAITVGELSSRILPITADVARVWAAITAQGWSRGYTIEVADGLIAATAMHHGLRVVTRNVKDFEPTGVIIINPRAADS